MRMEGWKSACILQRLGPCSDLTYRSAIECSSRCGSSETCTANVFTKPDLCKRVNAKNLLAATEGEESISILLKTLLVPRECCQGAILHTLLNRIHISVDGGWSAWTESDCTVSCGPGTAQKSRNCSDPKPIYGGAPCDSSVDGESKSVTCNLQPCPVGKS